MKQYDFVIIGGGPAGLSAAKVAAESGLKSLVIERDYKLGGQLVKQTHMFFGSEKQYAKTRGIDIARILINDCMKYPDMIEFMTETTVVGLYPDKVLTVLQKDKYSKIAFKALLVAAGASEKFLAFENNDLPGIYGAGAVQTLMNVHGVKPGENVVMVGSGNIGLIVSYQLLQAGVNVLKVIEAAPTIGGYKVHASKLKRLGVDIVTKHSIKRAVGVDKVEQVVIGALDDKWEFIEGDEFTLDVDAVCISVGLNPMTSLLSMANCKMKYVSKLGGNVPIIDHNHETSVENIFVAGDVCGVEEASSAIVEGYLSGLIISERLGYKHKEYDTLYKDFNDQLTNLRSGPFGKATRDGLKELRS
jgi:sarcosine oxidase subunit alpha